MHIEDSIREILKSYHDPFLENDLISTKALQEVAIAGQDVTVRIRHSYPCHRQEQQKQILALLQNAFPALHFTVQVDWQIEQRVVQAGLQNIASIKNIIAVASGKGGVGKSTTTVNLALALAEMGADVGILDADIYGPNQPHMLGITEKPEVKDEKKIQPLIRHGIQSMSIGYLIEKNAPVVWRGPMVTGALLQLLNETAWSSLDYLFIDMPPGTGDIALTLAQKIPVSGAIIVTTPQEVALLDARKGIEMFAKVKIPILGIVENMSTHLCSHCGQEESIFGSGGGQKIAMEYHVPLLGQVPLEKSIREQTDSGTPPVIAKPQSDIARRYQQIALKAAAQLCFQAKNYAARFPKITIEND